VKKSYQKNKGKGRVSKYRRGNKFRKIDTKPRETEERKRAEGRKRREEPLREEKAE